VRFATGPSIAYRSGEPSYAGETFVENKGNKNFYKL
jgi:hypothetical protein